MDRVMLAADLAGVVGFDKKKIFDFTSEEIARDLLREIVSCQQMGTVIYAMFCALNSPGLFQKPPQLVSHLD